MQKQVLNRGFLSTLPARGATHQVLMQGGQTPYFYPRSPRGERHVVVVFKLVHLVISIHAPREGSDPTALQPL